MSASYDSTRCETSYALMLRLVMKALSSSRTPNESQGQRARAMLLSEVTTYSKLERGAARGSLHRMVRRRSHRFTHGMRNSFQRLSSSSGGTSSTCVAIHQIFPKGSFTPPYRSPLGSVMMGKTETPPTLSARSYTLSESLT